MSETEPPPPGPESWVPAWDPDTGPQPTNSAPRSHRAPIGLSWLVSRLLAPLGAVGVVVLVIGLLIWINGKPAGGHASTAVAGGTAPTSSPLLLPTKTPSQTPSTAPATSPPATSTSPAPATSPSTKKSSTSSPVTHRHAADRNAMAPVQVLNNSRITGLAHEVAAQVEAHGWHVGTIGNLQGALPVTTVFYSAGDKAAARHLAREFSSIRSIEPNSAGQLTQTGITLVLTSDWAS